MVKLNHFILSNLNYAEPVAPGRFVQHSQLFGEDGVRFSDHFQYHSVQNVIGQIAAVPVSSTFSHREQLATSGVHRGYRSSFFHEGGVVFSVLLDKYNDGYDYGDIVIVSASGGRSEQKGIPNKDHQ